MAFRSRGSFVAVHDVDLREVVGAVRRLTNASTDLRPVWRSIKGAVRKDQRQHLKDRKGPTGASWPGLARSTIERRTKAASGSRKNLTKKGKLRKGASRKIGKLLGRGFNKGAKMKAFPMRVTFTARGPAAAVHQWSGRGGHGAKIPKRTFFWISDRVQRMTAHRIVMYLTGAWSGKKL